MSVCVCRWCSRKDRGGRGWSIHPPYADQGGGRHSEDQGRGATTDRRDPASGAHRRVGGILPATGAWHYGGSRAGFSSCMCQCSCANDCTKLCLSILPRYKKILAIIPNRFRRFIFCLSGLELGKLWQISCKIFAFKLPLSVLVTVHFLLLRLCPVANVQNWTLGPIQQNAKTRFLCLEAATDQAKSSTLKETAI